MVKDEAQTPDEYIASLPVDRRGAIAEVRRVVRENLPPGFEEGMQFGMIGWYVPLERFGDTYNGRPLGLAALASQKNHMSLYLNTVYGDPATEEWFRERFAASGKRLDRGAATPDPEHAVRSRLRNSTDALRPSASLRSSS